MEKNKLVIAQIEDFAELQFFESGNQQMDDFIHTYLEECDASHYCQTYAVRSSNDQKVLAIFSLAFDSVKLDEDDFDDMRIGAAGTDKPSVDEWFRDRFEEKAIYPALEIAYLAVSKDYQHQHLGSEILAQMNIWQKARRWQDAYF